MLRALLSLLLAVSLISCKNTRNTNFTPGTKVIDFSGELFSLNKQDIKTINLFSLLGSEKTVIHFFASWCGSCMEELPQLESFYQVARNKEVSVVGVAIQDEASKVAGLVKTYNLNFPIFLDNEKSGIDQLFKVSAVPESFILDHEGKFILFSDIDGMPKVRLTGARPWNSFPMKNLLLNK